MHKTTFKPHVILIVLLTGLLCFWSAQAMAQTPEEPTPPEPTPTEPTPMDPPAFITELVESTELTQEQVVQMRSDGLGWGNIMIATRLAERIAADSEGALTFGAALANVLNARAEGKGFGQIALENDLKLGHLLGDGETSDATNPPPFIGKLIESTELTQEQVDQMRSDGLGWGNIMIATRLAERIAADSEGTLTFADALAGVLSARAEGKGFGQIANENDLKLGRVLGKDNKGAAGAGPGAGIEDALGQAKKQSIFGRLLGLLGFDRKERPEKPSKPERLARAERPERPQKLERPERPEKLERLERPEKPAKPERPEKPERGPGR